MLEIEREGRQQSRWQNLADLIGSADPSSRPPDRVEVLDGNHLNALRQVHDVARRGNIDAVLHESGTRAVIGRLRHIALGVDAVAPHDGVLTQAGRDLKPAFGGRVFRKGGASESAVYDVWHVVFPVP